MDGYSTAFGRASLSVVLATLAACSAQEPTRYRLTTHVLAACPIERRVAEQQSLTLTPLGEFPASALELELGPERSSPLEIPATTLAFEAVTDRQLDGLRFVGYAERGAHTWVRILLWPQGGACSLGKAGSSSVLYPAPGGGQAIGYAPSERLLLVVGGRSEQVPAAAEGALIFDAGTGEIAPVESSAPEEPRAFATISRLGQSLVVAGGENPLQSSDAGGVLAASSSAEIFDPVARRFTGTRVELSVERTRHAAVTLADGDTLLVGGRGPFGALRALERISNETGRSSIAGLAPLSAPRLFPVVLWLDDERWFVGGGTALDGTPLSVLEWLSPDAREHRGVATTDALQPRVDRAFAAMPGGGVLAVGGCVEREPEDEAEAARCAAECNRGCPPEAYDAVWIGPDGSARRLLDFELAAPRPVLLGGSDGRPLLSSGRSGDALLHRFDPWTQRFETADALVAPAPRAGAVNAALDAAAFVWLNEGSVPSLYGLRMGTTSRYGPRGELFRPVPGRWPSALAPDRPIGSELVLADGGELVFSANTAVTVYAAGADYAEFSLEVEASAPPRVVLGRVEYGGAERPFPSPSASRFSLTRLADAVTLEAAEERLTYSAPEGRLRVGIGAPPLGATITRIAIERLGP